MANSTMDDGKRARKREGDDVSSDRRQNGADIDTVIDDLPNEILIRILSRLSLKEAQRTSVLSPRWRYLWTFTSGSLDFDTWDTVDGTPMSRKAFRSWVNHVLMVHQETQVDSFVVRFKVLYPARFLDKWICHAMKKEVRNLDIKLSDFPGFCRRGYEFPNVHKLSPHSYGLTSAFGSLKSLRLASVDICDEMVHYFLASCANLECLSICASHSTNNLQVVEPVARLKVLEISFCDNLETLEISAATLVSFTILTYDGFIVGMSLRKVPSLSEVSLGGSFCLSFLLDGDKHATYSFQLERLKLDVSDWLLQVSRRDQSIHWSQYYSLKHLEITTILVVGQSLLFYLKLIKSCPVLHEFRIKVKYTLCPQTMEKMKRSTLFPKVHAVEAPIFHHKNLKLVQLSGYIGCSSDHEFLTHLLKIAPALEMMTIDTQGAEYGMLAYDASRMKARRNLAKGLDYTHAKDRIQAKEFAERLQTSIPQETQFIII